MSFLRRIARSSGMSFWVDPQRPAVDGQQEPALDHQPRRHLGERRAEHELAELVDDLVQPLAVRDREELREQAADEVGRIVLDHDVERPLARHPAHEREQVPAARVLPGRAGLAQEQVTADAERLGLELELGQDPGHEVVGERRSLPRRTVRDVAAGDELQLIVEHEHAGHGSPGRSDQRAQVGHRLELDLPEQLGVRVIDQRLDVEDLLLRQILHQRELAIPGGRLAGVAEAVICERDRRGQHREDQGIQEQDAPHRTQNPAPCISLVSAEGC